MLIILVCSYYFPDANSELTIILILLINSTALLSYKLNFIINSIFIAIYLYEFILISFFIFNR